MTDFLTYAQKDNSIYRLTGTSKLLFFLIWSLVGMITYDTRILFLMLVISLIIFKIAKIDYRQISLVFKVIMFFLFINVIAIYLFAPNQGTLIYGTKTVICHVVGPYYLTQEQLFYEMNIVLKYLIVIPASFIFIITTNPSEFAASFNKLKVPYTVCYSVALALRYIPDIKQEFEEIKDAQEARGINISSGAKWTERLKNMSAIIFPLIFSSMERIDSISNAMELRGFGKKNRRTWYAARPYRRQDYYFMGSLCIFAVLALAVTFYHGSRFYNPFH